jgi:hypothetical protein
LNCTCKTRARENPEFARKTALRGDSMAKEMHQKLAKPAVEGDFC